MTRQGDEFCEEPVSKQGVPFPLRVREAPHLPAAQLENLQWRCIFHIAAAAPPHLLLPFSLVHSSSFQIQRPGQDGRLCDGVRWRREG